MADNKRNVMSDEELIEFIRYAMLERGDFDLSNEFSAAIYSTWFLMNPLLLDGRSSVESHPPHNIPAGSVGSEDMIRFTSHAHHGEPQTASPDDLVIYSSKNDDTVNFITDGFSLKKIN